MRICVVAAPEGLDPPELEALSATSILITWNEPQFPNGVILRYLLERRRHGDDVTVLVHTFSPDDQRNFVDDNVTLRPYTVYKYHVTAETEAGASSSSWQHVTTKSSREYAGRACAGHCATHMMVLMNCVVSQKHHESFR